MALYLLKCRKMIEEIPRFVRIKSKRNSCKIDRMGDISMSFVDDLRNMPSKSSQDASKRNERFKEEVSKIIAVIHQECVSNRDNRKLEGMIVRKYDNEYCQEGFKYLKSLERDNTRELSSIFVKKGAQYSASMVSDEYMQYRDGLKPVSSSQTECQTYITEVGKKLRADGFSVSELTTQECYYEYDEVKHSIISSKKYFVRKRSNELLGYAIKFRIAW